jgi:predicted nuclease of restriction endonuclease-like (RecB) superfamily
MATTPTLPDDYPQLLERLKREISSSRTRAAFAVNTELIGLYWRLGREIIEREGRDGWGASVTKRLSLDLRREFPEMTGLAERNLRYMRDFARAWPDESIWQQPVAKLPWGHICRLLDKLDDPAARLWYAQSTVEYGWSRKVLEHHIATGRYEREGKALTNFSSTLTRQVPPAVCRPDQLLRERHRRPVAPRAPRRNDWAGSVREPEQDRRPLRTGGHDPPARRRALHDRRDSGRARSRGAGGPAAGVGGDQRGSAADRGAAQR